MDVDPQVPNSPPAPNPFSHPVNPGEPPFVNMPPPDHISFQKYQASCYDATSQAPMGAFVQKESGPLDLTTGQFTGEGFASGPTWKQV